MPEVTNIIFIILIIMDTPLYLKHLLAIIIGTEPISRNSRPLSASVVMAQQAVAIIIRVRFMAITTKHITSPELLIICPVMNGLVISERSVMAL